MKQIIKQAKRLGNASGVVLPKDWENALVKVQLVSRPLSPAELMNVLQQEIALEDVVGVYLVGSYSRGDNDTDSDIDILVISNDINRDITKGKYQITIVSQDTMKKYKGYPLYYSMLQEAKPILNGILLENYRTDLSVSIKGVKEYLQAARRALRRVDSLISDKEEVSTETADAVAYSLILRLRGLYILDCIAQKKQQSKQELLALIRKVAGSLNIYNRYVAMKNDEEGHMHRVEIKIEEAIAIRDYLQGGITRWAEMIKEERKF